MWWKKKHEAQEKEEQIKKLSAENARLSGGVFSNTANTATPSKPGFSVKKTGIEIHRLYGNLTDPSNAARVALDLSPEDAQGLVVGDTVNVLNSNLYRGFYKILEVKRNGGATSLLIDTRYIGSENGIYLSSEKIFVSPFTASLKPKTAFI